MGTCVVANPAGMDVPWARSALARFQPAMSLNYPEMDQGFGQRLSVTINPEHLDKWLAGSGHSANEILALAKERQPLPHFPLDIRLKAKAQARRAEVESPNVVAILPGDGSEAEG